MSDTNEPSGHWTDSRQALDGRADSTHQVGLADSEVTDTIDDYIDFARSAGSSCRHLNRARRHRYESRVPGDDD